MALGLRGLYITNETPSFARRPLVRSFLVAGIREKSRATATRRAKKEKKKKEKEDRKQKQAYICAHNGTGE